MSKIKEIAEELGTPVAAQLGLTLYDVEYKKEGSEWRLTYFIDKEGGVSLTDCENFSHIISDILDEKDPIEQNYTLTVSSPGIERRLTKAAHYEAVIGKEIEVRLFAAKNGEKKFTGILESYTDGKIVLNVNEEKIGLEMNDISQAKLVYHF